MTGKLPFNDSSINNLFIKIVKDPIKITTLIESSISTDAISFIS